MTDQTPETTEWWHYIQKGIDHAGITQSRFADLVGMARPSMSRWRTSGVTPTDPYIIRNVARILQTPYADALQALAVLTPGEAAQLKNAANLSDYTNHQLLTEIEHRMRDDTQ